MGEDMTIGREMFADILARLSKHYTEKPEYPWAVSPFFGTEKADALVGDILRILSDGLGTCDGMTLYEYMVLNWSILCGEFSREDGLRLYDKFTFDFGGENKGESEGGVFQARLKGTSAVVKVFRYRDERDKVDLQSFLGGYLSYSSGKLVMDRDGRKVCVNRGDYIVEVPNGGPFGGHCVMNSFTFGQFFEIF